MFHLKFYLKTFFLLCVVASLASCGDDDSDEPDNTYGDFTKSETQIIKKLVGTSWYSYSVTFYDDNDKETSFYDQSQRPIVATFTDQRIDDYGKNRMLYVDLDEDKYGYDGYTKISSWYILGNQIEGMPYAGYCFGEILKLTDNE